MDGHVGLANGCTTMPMLVDAECSQIPWEGVVIRKLYSFFEKFFLKKKKKRNGSFKNPASLSVNVKPENRMSIYPHYLRDFSRNKYF